MAQIDEFLRRVGEVIGTFQATPGSMHRRIWTELGPWLQSLTMEAAPKWLSQLAAQQACHCAALEHGVPQHCQRIAVVTCTLCRGATCLEHAFIDRTGDAICYVCASRVMASVGPGARPPAQQRPPPPPHVPDITKELAWARKQLKVGVFATLQELHTAHRQLSAHWHPDRYRTEAQKANAERRFKEIQRAFELLKKDLEGRSAA